MILAQTHLLLPHILFPLVLLAVLILAAGFFFLARRLGSGRKHIENLVVKAISQAQDALHLSSLPVQSSTVGGYSLVEKLFESATSFTYLGVDLAGGKFLVKVPSPRLLDDAQFLERFRKEAESIREVNHTNIGRYVEYGLVKERGKMIPYFVLEYHEGKRLSEIIRQDAPLPINLVIRIMQQIADALSSVHERGILHRFLKPDNVQICPNWRVMLYSFGTEYAGEMLKITQAGSMAPATNYLSPEQILGKPVDLQADLYSLGVMGFEMITGQFPFGNDDIITISQRKLEEEPPSVTDHRRDTPPELAHIIERLISLDLSRRFSSAATVRDDLQKILYS